MTDDYDDDGEEFDAEFRVKYGPYIFEPLSGHYSSILWNPQAYIASTRNFTLQQDGAYRRLLDYSAIYTKLPGFLPNDVGEIYQILALSGPASALFGTPWIVESVNLNAVRTVLQQPSTMLEHDFQNTRKLDDPDEIWLAPVKRKFKISPIPGFIFNVHMFNTVRELDRDRSNKQRAGKVSAETRATKGLINDASTPLQHDPNTVAAIVSSAETPLKERSNTSQQTKLSKKDTLPKSNYVKKDKFLSNEFKLSVDMEARAFALYPDMLPVKLRSMHAEFCHRYRGGQKGGKPKTDNEWFDDFTGWVLRQKGWDEENKLRNGTGANRNGNEPRATENEKRSEALRVDLARERAELDAEKRAQSSRQGTSSQDESDFQLAPNDTDGA